MTYSKTTFLSFVASVVISCLLFAPLSADAALIGYWPMDGNATNSVSGGPALTVETGVSFAVSPNVKLGAGSATNFAQNFGLAVTNTTDNTALDSLFETGSFTVALWAQSTEAPGFAQRRYLFDYGSVDNNAVSFGIHPDGSIFHNFNGQEDSSSFDETTNTSWTEDQWHHFALTYDAVSDTLRFYFDGELKDSNTSIASPNINSALSHALFTEGPFSFGVQSKQADNGRFLVGYLDDAVLYDEVIGGDSIALWAGGLAANQLSLPVPEPSSLLLLCLGMVGLAQHSRRRRPRA